MNARSYKPEPSDESLDARHVEALADTMFALSTPSRLAILASLRHGPRTVSEIIDAVEMEQSAVSHQLRVLRDHSLVSVERRGRERVYAMQDEHVAALLDEGLRHVLSLEFEGASGSESERSATAAG